VRPPNARLRSSVEIIGQVLWFAPCANEVCEGV
jgi:hypothetical protein